MRGIHCSCYHSHHDTGIIMTERLCFFQMFSSLLSQSTASATVAAAASYDRNQMSSIRVIPRRSTLCHMAGSNLA
jgi:hypothetical protein